MGQLEPQGPGRQAEKRGVVLWGEDLGRGTRGGGAYGVERL